MRVHVVNGEIAENIVTGAFVFAVVERGSAEIGPTSHADEALVVLDGNPITPRLDFTGSDKRRSV